MGPRGADQTGIITYTKCHVTRWGQSVAYSTNIDQQRKGNLVDEAQAVHYFILKASLCFPTLTQNVPFGDKCIVKLDHLFSQKI